MRVPAEGLGPESDGRQQLRDTVVARLALQSLVDRQRLADAARDRRPRVERRVRVLEDDLHVAPDVAQLLRVERDDVAAHELDAATRRVDEPEHDAGDGRLARTALAHEPQRLAGADAEVDAVDGVDAAGHTLEQAGVHGEVLAQAARLEQQVVGGDPTVAGGAGGDAGHGRGGVVAGPVDPAAAEHQLLRPEAAHQAGAIASLERDRLRGARVERVRAPRVEPAPTGHLVGARHLTGDHVQLAALRGRLRHRVEQALGVGVAREREQRVDRRLLHDLARVHHDDAVADLRDDAEVMRDEQHGHPEVALQLAEQLEDLGLDRDVERGGGLVGDQQLRLVRQRHRDHRPLAHATRERVG